MSNHLSLRVNGNLHEVHADPSTPLLYVLRNDLGLKATRYGCGLGQCGACTVLIDGKKRFACDVPLWEAAGKSVSTVEGLAPKDNLHALQQAIIDEQAAQCGYCVNGVLMAAKALLDANPNPTRNEIAEALDSNLCRCGTHLRIIRAIERAAKTLLGGAR